MSDERPEEEPTGLEYLIRVRPQAMQSLFSLLSESGRHLDPKTRLLISIVTHVMDFSPHGLRQDIPRALREGTSRDEVIDAILCCLAAVGLSKVVDSIDVLRSLDLSEFETAEQDEEDGEEEEEEWIDFPDGEDEEETGPTWVPVLDARDLDAGQVRRVDVRGKEIALFNVDGEVRALANICPHLGSRLDAGAIEGNVLTCPSHSWQFNMETGACLNQPDQSVQTYQVRVVEEEIQVLDPGR